MPWRNKTILIVDDHPFDIELAIDALQRNQLTPAVQVAEDGLEAIDYVLCQRKHADQKIEDRPRQDVAEGHRLCASAFVQKPVDFEDFRRTISEIGHFWLLDNEPPPQRLFAGQP